ncbi:MAG: hypothetical protein ABUT39_23730 [Acidobacteriota bacterium]
MTEEDLFQHTRNYLVIAVGLRHPSMSVSAGLGDDRSLGIALDFIRCFSELPLISAAEMRLSDAGLMRDGRLPANHILRLLERLQAVATVPAMEIRE